MATLSPKFLVFDSRPESEEGGLIYCKSKDANVQWPKSVRRGRPRKNLEEYRCSLKYPSKEVERPLKERYKFVDCLNGRPLNDPNTRKFVRTHVMHNYRQQKQIAAYVKPGLQVAGIERQDNEAQTNVELEHPLAISPERWSKDPFDSFPMKMQPYMHDLLYLYISAVADYLYPIETYWGFNPTKKLWVPLALTDPALLSSILCSVGQFRARMSGQKEHPSALNHLKQTIRILNERLQGPLQEIGDSTIAAIAGLALTEQSSDNQENWRVHIKGIKQMVEMRGGLLAFECNPILHDKLCRADICGSIYALSKPYLQMESRKLQPSILRGCNEMARTLGPGFQAVLVDYGFDSDLFDILSKVHTVTRDINTVKPPKSEIIPLRLREKIRSVQYYFLSRDNYNDSSVSGDPLLEACRLGVLLYVGIIQNDFGVSPISKQFLWQLKSCLQRETLATDSIRALRLWLIFLAGSLVFDPTEKSWFICSIVQAVSQLSISSWCDAKLLLESFAWVGRLQDKPGQELWDEAMRTQTDLQK